MDKIDKGLIIWCILEAFLVVLVVLLVWIQIVFGGVGYSLGYSLGGESVLGDSFGNSFVGEPGVYYEDFSKVDLWGFSIDRELYIIIECESKFDPLACNGDRCQYGRGLAQIVSETEKECEKVLGREIDPFDPVDNLACAVWLYDVRGTNPWGCAECSWGSYACWGS